ncbi:tubulin polyglutamylase TTLL5 [Pelodytes ibericus]
MTKERPETGDDPEALDGDQGDYHSILWTGSVRKVPILIFHAEAIVTKELALRAVGEHYHLAYKMVRTDSHLIRSILSAHGFQEVNANSNSFNLMWTGSHVKPNLLMDFTSFQKVNHFPRSYELTRKDRLYKNIQRMQQKHGVRNFNLLPHTYLLPSEYQEFCYAFCKDRGPWIVKPVASSRGRGVYLINSPSQISMENNILVSRYIGNPLLIDGFKFDIRLYVLITSYDPLIIYLYEEGLTRFATVRYDRTAKHIKNQFMHLTNYSVNKKSGDYVSCDDPEVEDYGNKWSMSAMLRYLKQDGKDTAALMSQIEDLIIKTVISGERPIASACKSFLAHRGNCFELYGFDVLIDGNLKPWLLEVNLSPSLACDAPLDLKVKASVISDMLTLIGMECQDPQQRNRQGGSAKNEHSQKSLCQRPLTASDIDTRLQAGIGEKTLKRTSQTLGLSVEEMKILRQVEEEEQRRGGFIRIFPRNDTWHLYGSFLECKTSMNYMLACNLFPNRPPINGKYESGPRRHSILYERKLVPLKLRRARQRNITRKPGLSHHDPCSVDAQSNEQEEEDSAEEEEDPEKEKEVEKEQVLPLLDIQTSEPQQPRINLLEALKKDANLSKVQARLAFSCFLQRMQSRLQSESDPDRLLPNEEEHLGLVMRFLQRAASKLHEPLCITFQGLSIPLLERRRLMAKHLGDFIHLYNKETEQIRCSDETSDCAAKKIDPADFQEFIAAARECELEEILTFYTHKNKTASVFLETSSNTNCREAMGKQRVKVTTISRISNSYNHISELPASCAQPVSTVQVDNASSIVPPGGRHLPSSSVRQTSPVCALSVPRTQSNSLGNVSSFQSAAQIYSQRLSRPTSTHTVRTQQSALRTRCSSAGTVKAVQDTYNLNAVSASLQRLADRQTSRPSYSQLQLFTHQLSRMNIGSGSVGKVRCLGSASHTLQLNCANPEPSEHGVR